MLFIYILCLILVVISLIIFISNRILESENNNHPIKEEKKKPDFCILIPAKDESKVIRGPLDSIKNQTYKINMQNVYVIVEDIKDPTVNICKEYKCNYIVRKHLELKRKGYALDEAIKQIKKEYDAYFIIDADNILDKDFFKYMSKVYQKGYDIGVGYRDNKNWSSNVISACSGLVFTIANNINKRKNKTNENITITGTGFYIKGNIIKEFGGYPFHEITEDYELTLYATVHKLTTCYEERAIFYDEQPTTLKASIKQRIRWIRGYFNARVNYLPQLKEKIFDNQMNYGSVYKEIMWLRPILILALAFVIFYLAIIINQIYMLIKSTYEPSSLILGLIVIGITYLVMMFFTIYQLISERKHIKVKNSLKVKIILYNPIFLLTFIYCAIAAIVKKNITWERIEHTKTNIE